MDFNTNYRDFLREYIDKKYLQQYNNLIVLAENFVDNYYVVLFETQEDTLYHTMPVNGLQRSVLVGQDQFLKLFQYGVLTLSRKVSDYIINSIAILF